MAAPHVSCLHRASLRIPGEGRHLSPPSPSSAPTAEQSHCGGWRGILNESGEDSLHGLPNCIPRCPLTPSLSPQKRSTSQSKTEPPLLRTNKRTIYTAGRPPWYNVTGTTFKEAFVIGLCGGSASGKTTVANKIIEALDVPWVVLLSMDSFYKVLDEDQQELAAKNEYNFDHPDAFDFELLVSVLRKLKKGKSIKVPVYDFTSHCRRKEWKTVYGANVVIFEGILAFANKELLKLLDMKVFVDTDSDIRLIRRLKRDVSQRGRDIGGIIKQYNKFVKPAFEQYIEPTVPLADIVVPRGGDNFVALDLIVQHVHSQLEKREINVRSALASAHQGQPLPETLSVLKSTPQVRGMHTIIRNKETSRDEFIFYSKRLMRLLIEHALSFLPLKPVSVETPQGDVYDGRGLNGKRITGVSILRAGETMEQALMAVCKDIRLGKILIQTNHDTAALPATAQRHQRGLRHPDGQHRVHRRCCSHGRQSAAGPRRAGGQDLPVVVADGRDGRPLGGLRLPQRENHHHCRGQGSQRALPHHPGHR
ncbi:uridine-cytidine kinase-like 1 isoform X3 [Dunckerocampus dactyliophorus]|uniref:uridine-cytidine kinase-like 1 isoform X3 n=1 Tax=Dunckerocampus dactyliophorus TaxID=161453 RepID=UPI002405A283|nr:uridine-cytidine kinase-like 1 isoform X3 [Dunckerocampus dactyliophorus]